MIIIIGVWDEINGLQLTTDIQFFDNTTVIPDIDVRQPFDYWFVIHLQAIIIVY